METEKTYAVVINDGKEYSVWGVFNTEELAVAHLENAEDQGYTGYIDMFEGE